MAAAADYSVSGVILDDQMRPVADAVLSLAGRGVVRTDAEGRFAFKDVREWSSIRVKASGFYPKEIRVTSDCDHLVVSLIPADRRGYNQTLVRGISDNAEQVVHNGGIQNVARKDFIAGAVTLDKALQGSLDGLLVTQKSGMTGEGSQLSIRGIRSFVAATHPLIVINGVPQLADASESALIGGYSRSLFQAINPQDIANVTLLTGAEASAWGSLGSNGVLLIETDGAKSDDLDTRVTFAGSFGLNWQQSSLPLMNASQYKSYLSDIAMDYYDNDMGAFFSEFGFMASPTANNAHLYAFDTSWQDAIFRNSATHDYLFRVEGGDAIAKYDISLGYTGDEGTLEETKSDRFQAQINANVLVSKKVELNANVNLAYLNGQYQEQGHSLETNPLLAAYRRSPLLSPYQSSKIPSSDGSYALLSTYSSYYMGASTNTDFIVSNPVSIVNSVDGSIRQYDVNGRLQLVYNPSTHLSLAATVGLYVNYDKEKLFVPGIDHSDIVPRFDAYGEARNTVKVGQGNVYNFFYGVSGRYHRLFDLRHDVDVRAAFQVLKSTTEYDMATGRNTANDFYQTMGDAQSVGRYFSGYNDKWNWLNGSVSADYTYGNLARAGVVMAVDGASSVGTESDRLQLYPGVHGTVMLRNWCFMESASWIDRLDLNASLALTGNSRFSSKLGQYYYTSQPYQTIAGIVRANVPNTHLVPERDRTFQASADMAVLHNRFSLRAGYFSTLASDVLMQGRTSSVMGTSPYYCNDGQIRNRGLEAGFNIVPLLTRDFRLTLAASTTHLRSEVRSLGGESSFKTTLPDGAELISAVGGKPYEFYGYRAEGVYSTTAEARRRDCVNRNSVAYQAGDVIFTDQNEDGIINDHDKVSLGSALPDFYGSFFASLEWKGFALDASFVYSEGNHAYNATRRITESSADFSNQSLAVVRRWQNEGDVTDMPRAAWGDVIGNNDFSSRFVEDASYIKLRDVTLSYSWQRPLLRFIQSGTVFVSGQNLLCLTSYLGSDPEFASSNAASLMGVDCGKVALPRSVKIGVNLKF